MLMVCLVCVNKVKHLPLTELGWSFENQSAVERCWRNYHSVGSECSWENRVAGCFSWEDCDCASWGCVCSVQVARTFHDMKPGFASAPATGINYNFAFIFCFSPVHSFCWMQQGSLALNYSWVPFTNNIWRQIILIYLSFPQRVKPIILSDDIYLLIP